MLLLFDQAYELRRCWRGHRINGDEQAVCGLQLSCALEDLAGGRFRDANNARLARHILKHGMDWFRFLIDPRVQSTNHWAERAIRPAVVNRKVWGGNRTWIGAQAQSNLMPILQTAKQRAVEPFHWLRKALTSPKPPAL